MLDGIHESDIGLGHGLLELIQVDHHEVDELDVVLSGLGHVLLGIAAAQQATVHLGVQGLDATVHHLGKPGELLDGFDLDASLLEHARGAARRDDLDAVIGCQLGSKLDHARLVRYRNQRTSDLPIGSHQRPPSHPGGPQLLYADHAVFTINLM